MFLLATFQLNMIGRCQYDDDVEDTLQVLPSSLHEVYDRILSKMEQRLQETPMMLHTARRFSSAWLPRGVPSH